MPEQRKVNIFAYRNYKQIDLTKAVRAIYDRLYDALDFGSGFLDSEDIAAMRLVGEAIGAEPFDYDTDPCVCGHQYQNHEYKSGGRRDGRCVCNEDGWTGSFWEAGPRCPCEGFQHKGTEESANPPH